MKKRLYKRKSRSNSSYTLSVLVFFIGACSLFVGERVLNPIKKAGHDLSQIGTPTLASFQKNFLPNSEKKKSIFEGNKRGDLLINPFRDIRLAYNNESSRSTKHEVQPTKYSSYRCVHAHDSNKDSTRFVTRSCEYINLYYEPETQKFHYFASPTERNVTASYYQPLGHLMEVSLGFVRPTDATNRDKVIKESIWKPEIHDSENDEPPSRYAIISEPLNLALLLYIPYYGFNPGHVLWDDALSLFTLIDTFRLTGLQENDRSVTPIPFFVQIVTDYYARCNVNNSKMWKKCTKMYNRLFPFLFRIKTHEPGDIFRTGNWLQGIEGENVQVHATNDADNILKNVNDGTKTILSNQDESDRSGWNQILEDTKFVLVPTVLAGIGRHGQLWCDGDCALHRSSQLFSFRNYLLHNIFYPDYDILRKQRPIGYITFSLPGGSSRPEEVSFFDNIIPIAKDLYGDDAVKVVDMAKLPTYKDEVTIAINTAVLFANHGGGSSTSIYLPYGSSVFLYGTQCRKHPWSTWCDGQKNHLDNIFYASNGYLRPTWIHTEERDNTDRIRKLLQMEYSKTMDVWNERGISV